MYRTHHIVLLLVWWVIITINPMSAAGQVITQNSYPLRLRTDPPSPCGNYVDADIVIMIDRTGSITSVDLQLEKDAAKTLLHFFETATLRPLVAIGTFNGPCTNDPDCEPSGNARMHSALTDIYGDDDGPGDGDLFAIIDEIAVGPVTGLSDLATALTLAQAALPPEVPPSSNYIILISDGKPNWPDPGDCSPAHCECPTAKSQANTAADAAEAQGTDIIAVHFAGTAFYCPGEPQNGLAFMEFEMATTPAYFFAGSSDLQGVFTAISEFISCDDGIFCNGLESCVNDICQPGAPPNCDDGVGCTIDACDEVNKVCANTPDDTFCDNGQFCDGLETCDPLNDCQPGVPLDCEEGIVCTVDTCDEQLDICIHTPDDNLCDNGLFCDGVEICNPTFDCQPGDNPCLGLLCDEANDVCVECFTSAECDDGVACNGEEMCVSGFCQPANYQDCNGNGIADPCDIVDGTSQDCNGNEIPDECDIDSGTSQDCQPNGIPDECEGGPWFYGDVNGDGNVNMNDLVCMQNGLTGLFNCPGVTLEDLDIYPCDGGNGDLNLMDLFAMLDALAGQPACPDPCP